jgi:hypothetical protein
MPLTGLSGARKDFNEEASNNKLQNSNYKQITAEIPNGKKTNHKQNTMTKKLN